MTNDDKLTGVYQIHQSDVDDYFQIERVKQGLTLRLSNTDLGTARSQFIDLYSNMQMFLEKAFAKKPDPVAYIKEKTVDINGHTLNFYDLKAITPGIENTQDLSLINEKMSSIFEYFAGVVLKLGLPTQYHNIKKN